MTAQGKSALLPEVASWAPSLGDDFAHWLAAAAPELAVPMLQSGRVGPALARRLATLPLPAKTAAELYRHLDGAALSELVVERRESRTGPLLALVAHARLGADVQAWLTGRKCHPDVAASLVDTGVTLGAASTLVDRGELDGSVAMTILDTHWDTLDPARIVALIDEHEDRAPVFCAWVMSRRADVRRHVLALGAEVDSPSLRSLTAIRLDEDEQLQVLAAFESGLCAPAAISQMLDRPTTTRAVRRRLWEIAEAADMLAPDAPVPSPRCWPEVAHLGDLDARSTELLVARPIFDSGGSAGPAGRAMQIVELLGALQGRLLEIARLRLADAVSHCRAGYGVFWIDAAHTTPRWGFAPAVHEGTQAHQRRVERASWAETATGIQPPDSTPVDAGAPPALVEADAAIEPSGIRFWDTARGRAAGRYLVARIGDCATAWSVALDLLPRWGGTVGKLADVALTSARSPAAARR